MKLFQKLLLAPAALGLLAPVAATAAEINIDDVAGYARKPVSQMRAAKATQFSDVVPGDWAYSALLNLSEGYGCVDNAYTQNLKSGQSLTRYEAAALVNSCLQGGVASVDANNSDLQRLTNEFGTEMAILKGRVDGLEYKAQELSAGQFSPTTKLTNKVIFNLGYLKDDRTDATAATVQDANGNNVFGNNSPSKLNAQYVFQTNVYTSFTGKDTLYTRLKTGNGSGPWENQGNGMHLSASNSNGNAIQVDKIWYEWPVSDSIKAWFGPRIEGYYMLASSPSIYKPVTKQFALGGNGSTYGSSTGAGFGVAWTQQKDDRSAGRWEVSSNYHASDGGHLATVGLLTDNRSKWLSKVAYGSPRWQVSLAMAKNMCDDTTPGTANDAETCRDYGSYYTTLDGETHTGNQTSYALKGYWKPESTGIIPAVQLGYEWSSIDDDGTAPTPIDLNSATGTSGSVEATKSWMMGLMWKDALRDGNTAGLAFGQPEHATDYVQNLAVAGPWNDPSNKAFAWEAYYDYKVNDGVTITPSIFGFNDRTNGTTGVNDGFGGLIQTTFKF